MDVKGEARKRFHKIATDGTTIPVFSGINIDVDFDDLPKWINEQKFLQSQTILQKHYLR